MSTARRLSLIALPVVALTALTACGEVTTEAGAGESETITVTDDQGREVTIEGPVERAVVLNSYGNEFVRAIGAGDTVVGVDRASIDRLPYLPVSEDDVIAEGLDQLNYEAIADLDPDVVVLPRNAVWQEATEQLSSFGIPVVVATAWDAAKVPETVSLLGEVFGQEEGAEQVIAFQDEIAGVLEDRLADVEPVSVYLEADGPYVTALPGSGFHDMIVAAGGRNVFDDASGGDAQEELDVDPAEVVLRAPDYIWHELPPSAEPTGDLETVADEIAARPGWGKLDAVTEGRVIVVNGWATSALGKAIGALYLASWLHPEELEGVDPDAYLERWVTEFQDTDLSSADDYVRGPAR